MDINHIIAISCSQQPPQSQKNAVRSARFLGLSLHSKGMKTAIIGNGSWAYLYVNKTPYLEAVVIFPLDARVLRCLKCVKAVLCRGLRPGPAGGAGRAHECPQILYSRLGRGYYASLGLTPLPRRQPGKIRFYWGSGIIRRALLCQRWVTSPTWWTIPLSWRQSHQQHRTGYGVCVVNYRFVRLAYINNSTSVKSHRTVSCQPTCPLIS